MKLVKPSLMRQCSAIVQPGEYVIDHWDNKQCTQTHELIVCDHCEQLFCLMMHWHKHTDSLEFQNWAIAQLNQAGLIINLASKGKPNV